MAADSSHMITIGKIPTGYHLFIISPTGPSGSECTTGSQYFYTTMYGGVSIVLSTTSSSEDKISVSDYCVVCTGTNYSFYSECSDHNVEVYSDDVVLSVYLTSELNSMSSGTDVTIGGVKFKGCTGAEYNGNEYSSLSVNGTTYNF